jgi:hypothetical protein
VKLLGTNECKYGRRRTDPCTTIVSRSFIRLRYLHPLAQGDQILKTKKSDTYASTVSTIKYGDTTEECNTYNSYNFNQTYSH